MEKMAIDVHQGAPHLHVDEVQAHVVPHPAALLGLAGEVGPPADEGRRKALLPMWRPVVRGVVPAEGQAVRCMCQYGWCIYGWLHSQ